MVTTDAADRLVNAHGTNSISLCVFVQDVCREEMRVKSADISAPKNIDDVSRCTSQVQCFLMPISSHTAAGYRRHPIAAVMTCVKIRAWTGA